MSETIKQSGVVPYFFEKKKIRFILVTSNSGKWIFPKGLLENHLQPWESGAIEALEEGGIEGSVFPDSLGEYSYKKWGATCKVKMYPLKVKDLKKRWAESSFRQRIVVDFKAAKSLIKSDQLEVLLQAYELLNKKKADKD